MIKFADIMYIIIKNWISWDYWMNRSLNRKLFPHLGSTNSEPAGRLTLRETSSARNSRRFWASETASCRFASRRARSLRKASISRSSSCILEALAGPLDAAVVALDLAGSLPPREPAQLFPVDGTSLFASSEEALDAWRSGADRCCCCCCCADCWLGCPLRNSDLNFIMVTRLITAYFEQFFLVNERGSPKET